MKKLLFNISLLGILGFAIACSKNINRGNAQLAGKWELRHAYGGMLGFDSTYAINSGNTIFFTKTKFEKYINGTVADTGSYTLSEKENVRQINFKGAENSYGSQYKILNDSLYLDFNAPTYDGIASVYVKVSQ